MIKYEFYLGTDTKGRLDEADAIKLAYSLAAESFPYGHSIREEDGRWMGEDGPVEELTVVVSWIAESSLISSGKADQVATTFAKAYKDGAYQEAVLIEKQSINAFTV